MYDRIVPTGGGASAKRVTSLKWPFAAADMKFKREMNKNSSTEEQVEVKLSPSGCLARPIDT